MPILGITSGDHDRPGRGRWIDSSLLAQCVSSIPSGRCATPSQRHLWPCVSGQYRGEKEIPERATASIPSSLFAWRAFFLPRPRPRHHLIDCCYLCPGLSKSRVAVCLPMTPIAHGTNHSSGAARRSADTVRPLSYRSSCSVGITCLHPSPDGGPTTKTLYRHSDGLNPGPWPVPKSFITRRDDLIYDPCLEC